MAGTRVEVFAIAAAGVLLLLVLELVRRRRLLERYALLWLLSAVVLIALAVWTGLLNKLAGWVGVRYPPSALFIVAFGFILVLLLHFSVAVSRLSDQSKVLAQRIALLEDRLRRAESPAAAEEEQPGPEALEAPAEPVARATGLAREPAARR